MKKMLIALVARFIPTIGHTAKSALKITRMTDAARLRSRNRSTRVCSSETMSSALPIQPNKSSQCSLSQVTREGYFCGGPVRRERRRCWLPMDYGSAEESRLVPLPSTCHKLPRLPEPDGQREFVVAGRASLTWSLVKTQVG